jgi:hypothetical protein
VARGLISRVRQNGTTGKITRLPVKPLKSKTIRFTGILIYGINPASRPTEGRFAIVTIRWAQDAMAAAISGVTA